MSPMAATVTESAVCKAVVGGTAGSAMAVPLFCRACNNCNIVLFFVFKLNQNKSNNFINQPIYSFG